MASKKYLIGDTVRATWVSSGVTPSPIYFAVFDGTETLVSSATMASSGNGHYYLDYTMPTSSGHFAAEYNATIGGLPYKKRMTFKTVRSEVD